jgi:uncharacterized protein (DUF433 family)
VSGAWVFKGTRLPVATVIENLEDLSLEEVMEQFARVPQLQRVHCHLRQWLLFVDW